MHPYTIVEDLLEDELPEEQRRRTLAVLPDENERAMEEAHHYK